MLAFPGVRLFLSTPVPRSPWTSKDGGQILLKKEMVTKAINLRSIVTIIAGD